MACEIDSSTTAVFETSASQAVALIGNEHADISEIDNSTTGTETFVTFLL
jgi:hypothetical protein